MANTKTSALAALTTVTDGDLLPMVDVSDTTMAPTGTNKKVTAAQLASYVAVPVQAAVEAYADALIAGIVLPNPQDEDFQEYYSGPPVTAESTAYYGYPAGTPTTAALTLNRMYLIPVLLDRPTRTIVRIGIGVTTGGAAGAVIRLGLYDSDIGGNPGVLIADLGTISGENIATVEMTLEQEVTPYRRLLWVAVCPQVITCSTRSVGTYMNPLVRSTSAAFAVGAHVSQFRAGVTGALPNPANASTDPTSSCPAVALRFVDGAGSDFDTLQALIAASTTIGASSFSATGLLLSGDAKGTP